MSNPKFTSDLTGYLIVAEYIRPGDIPFTFGDWDGGFCPECGGDTLSNNFGERWCGCRFIKERAEQVGVNE